jgi:hypothetical protein
MHPAHPGRPVVVGVDGSEASLAAVDWAVGEAVARHTWLRVVRAFIWPLFPYVPLGPSPYGPPDGGLRAMAERIVDESVKRATNDAPGLSVDGELSRGPPNQCCSPSGVLGHAGISEQVRVALRERKGVVDVYATGQALPPNARAVTALPFGRLWRHTRFWLYGDVIFRS